MFCLFYAETYKLKKSKSFYICTIVTAAFVFLMYGMLLMADNIQKGKIENGTGGVVVSINDKITDSEDQSIWDTISIADLMQQVFSGDVIGCILAIFCSIFVIGEFSSGMLKNITGKGCSRCSIYVSKLAATVLAAVLIALTGMVTVLLAGRIFIGPNVLSDSLLKNLPVYAGLQLLMVTAIVSLFVWIAQVSRNLAADISIGICTAFLPALLLNVVDMRFADTGIIPSEYWPFTRIASCPFSEITASYIAETIFVAVFWTVLTTILGIWHFYKTDIK